MYKDYAYVKSSVAQVCQSLKAETLMALEPVVRISGELDAISDRLRFGIIPHPDKIKKPGAVLWLERMRMIEIHGRQSVIVSELEKVVNLLEQVCRILKRFWFYREWGASGASTIVSGLVIIPAFLVLWMVLCAGGPVLLCTLFMGCFLGVGCGMGLLIKDHVVLFWSMYSYIPLYVFFN
ncbi:TPA: hypothetical protein ACOEF8_004097 [Enterobacter roggenkampii]